MGIKEMWEWMMSVCIVVGEFTIEVSKLFAEILKEGVLSFLRFIEKNLINIAKLILLALPYYMWHLGVQRREPVFGGEMFVPLIGVFCVWFMTKLANKLGKGTTMPIQRKRFTEVNQQTGEVFIENDRLQELILHMADHEDWQERHGYLKTEVDG